MGTQLQLSQCCVWGRDRCNSRQLSAVQLLDVIEWDTNHSITREWCIISRESHPIKKPYLWDLKGNLIYIIIMQHSNVLPISLGFGFVYISGEERILVFCFQLNCSISRAFFAVDEVFGNYKTKYRLKYFRIYWFTLLESVLSNCYDSAHNNN